MSLLTRLRRQPTVRLGFVLLVLIGWSLAPRPVSAEDSASPRLAAVYFKLEDGVDAGSGPLSELGANRPARYRSFSVVDGAESRRVAPATGSIGIRLSGSQAAWVTAQVGADQVGVDDGDFGNALADALAATRVDRFGRFGQLPDGGAVTVDLIFARPLAASDYLLVQEAGGDADVTLTPIDATGAALGEPILADGPYQWDMGRSDLDGTPLWARVVRVPATTDGAPTPGVRIETTHAQLKVLALTDLVEEASPTPAGSPTTGTNPAAGSASSTAASGASSTPAAAPQEVAVPTAASSAGLSIAEGSDEAAAIATLQEDTGASNAAVDRAPEPVATPAPTTLAMTGPANDPWVLTFVAMGLIFFGWTIMTAVRGPRDRERNDAGNQRAQRSHAQLDALGFD